jgi:hypothetical protein
MLRISSLTCIDIEYDAREKDRPVLAEERCSVRTPSLHRRTVATSLLSLVFAAAFASSACDNDKGVGIITTAPTAAAYVIVSPSLINLTALGGFNCPGHGFSPTFTLFITSNGTARSMSAATFTLLDGTTVGGPSVTIPSTQLSQQFGSTIILANQSRSFPMQPTFGCPVVPVPVPHAMNAVVKLVDSQGREESLSATVNIQ